MCSVCLGPLVARKLTDVQDPVPGPAPAPSLQLLVLCVLQPAVVENHTDDALGRTGQVQTAKYGDNKDPRGTSHEGKFPTF